MTPGLAWLRRWGISIASFVGGLLTLFVFRRELDHIPWVVGYLLLLWLLFALLTQVRQTLEASEKKAHRLVVTAFDYTIQSLYHGVLLFLLPAYWASTTLDAGNVVFLLLLVGLVVLATFDPWYQALVHPRPWAGAVFFVVSIFGALNVALPLIGLPPDLAVMLSAWIAVVALTPAVCRAWDWRWSRGLAVTAVVAVAGAALLHAGREWIPPAPLSLARSAVAWDVAGLDPAAPIGGAVSAADLRARGLVAHTAVFAPAGLNQPVRHVWRHEGRTVNVVELSPVRGGRREGFRTYSRKTSFPADPTGRWHVDVVTRSGRLIGRLRFRVTP